VAENIIQVSLAVVYYLIRIYKPSPETRLGQVVLGIQRYFIGACALWRKNKVVTEEIADEEMMIQRMSQRVILIVEAVLF